LIGSPHPRILHLRVCAYTVPPQTQVTRYSRQDVLRILHLHPRQLAQWERAGLIHPWPDSGSDQDLPYTFKDLSEMRTLRDLQSTRISVRNIRNSVDAIQRVAGMRNPLREASLVRRGSRLTFRHAGALVDPLTRQLAFDFDLSTTCQLRVVRIAGLPPASSTTELQDLFLRAVRLEESPSTRDKAVALYHQILDLDPNHAPACINLGTIHYALRDFTRAELMYRRATLADPDYALAFFDLGNVLDELLRLPEAIAAYQRAIALVPTYADAHYNLALAYERNGERRRALASWLTYVRLDPIGPWASHARGQAKKILSAEPLSIVSRFGKHSPRAV
jgi:tetratricopeptide (TPR) repeat protein